MSSVGQFPGMARKPRAVRGPINPIDKSTIVSIYPHKIDEWKRTLSPGIFVIEPGSYDKPSLLIVGTSSWWKDVNPEEPLLEIPVSSVQIADSIVKDYCNGLLGCDMASSMPGLFFIPGEHTIISIKKDHKNLLDKAKERQTNWYKSLVKLGDALWARSNGNPLVIADDMKLAAQELQLKEKPWMKDNIFTTEMDNCPNCGSMRNKNYPTCPNCKTVIDEARFKSLGLRFAS